MQATTINQACRPFSTPSPAVWASSLCSVLDGKMHLTPEVREQYKRQGVPSKPLDREPRELAYNQHWVPSVAIPLLATLAGQKFSVKKLSAQLHRMTIYRVSRHVLGAMVIEVDGKADKTLTLSAMVDASQRPSRPEGIVGMEALESCTPEEDFLVFDSLFDYDQFCSKHAMESAATPPACCVIGLHSLPLVSACRGRLIICSDALPRRLMPVGFIKGARICRILPPGTYSPLKGYIEKSVAADRFLLEEYRCQRKTVESRFERPITRM